MKIWVHPYELKARQAERVKDRRGALVKVEWAVGQTGFSDLHPWPEFGDADLDTQIKSLADLTFTPLSSLSLEFNYQDREYRLLKRNAFAGLILPRAHRLFFSIDELDPQILAKVKGEGFTHLKVKMGEDLKRETEALLQLTYSTTLLWRLDMNGKIAPADFENWWTGLDPAVRARIDYIEDPTSARALKIGGPWADDWNRVELASVRVVKPARERRAELSNYRRVVYTHSLDHSFGRACALWSAGRYYADHPKRLEVCGLASSDVYEPDAFSSQWNCPGPRLKPTTGYGFGFDEILGSLSWQKIL